VEALSLIALEAMSRDCICITADFSCLPEVFENTAVYYSPKIAGSWQKQLKLHWPGATVNEMECMD